MPLLPRVPADVTRIVHLEPYLALAARPIRWLFVAAVAKRLIAGLLASAEELAAILFGCPFDRRKLGILVRTIAKWLLGRLSAGAPEIGFAGFDFDRDGRVTGAGGACKHEQCGGDKCEENGSDHVVSSGRDVSRGPPLPRAGGNIFPHTAPGVKRSVAVFFF